MARPSKLTEQQWAEVARRLAAGERVTDLAKEYKVSKAAISNRVSKRIETVKAVANQLVSAESALRKLPVSDQLLTLDLADELRSISTHMAGAGRLNAATSHRLAQLVNVQVQKLDDVDPLKAESMEALKGIAVLTKMSNEAAVVPLGLLNANKERLKDGPPDVPAGLTHFYGETAAES